MSNRPAKVEKLEEICAGKIIDYKMKDGTLVGTAWMSSGGIPVIHRHDEDGEMKEQVIRLERYDGWELDEYI